MHRARRLAQAAAGGTALVLLLAACSTSSTSTPATVSPTTSAATASPAATSEQPTPTESSDSATPDASTSSPSSQPSSEPTGGPTTQPVAQSGDVTMVFTGEVLMHKSLIDQALQNGGGRDFDFRPMFDEIKGLISSADLAVCHLELPVIPKGEGMEPRYATPPQVIDALKYAGFDRCSTASNHALDRGAKGNDATLAAFKRNGMTEAGTAGGPGGLEPTVLDVRGIKVTHLSYTEVGGKPIPAGQPWRMAMASKPRILADVTKARELGAEYVVVSIHDADELAYRPTRNQTDWDTWLVEKAGVDLVVGTGSHVPEKEDADKSAFVLYGLGNLINWRLNARDSVIAKVALYRDESGAVKARAPELIPTFTVEKLGYQVLDARGFRTARFDPDVRQYLRESLDRVKPYVGPYVPPLSR